MQLTKANIILSAFCFLFASMTLPTPALAEEADASAEAATAEGPGADREWAKRTTKLNILQTKRGEFTKQIQNYIEIKKTKRIIKDEKGNSLDVLEQIAEAHRKLKEVVADYNKEKAELKYRFPEEGALIERRYMPLRVQTLEQIEREMGLTGELTKAMEKIAKKYATFMEDEAPRAPTPAPIAVDPTYKEKAKPGEEAPVRLKLTK